jgi:hypothetical protein
VRNQRFHARENPHHTTPHHSTPQRIDIDMTFWRGNSATRSKSAFVIVGAGGVSEVHWTFDEDRGVGMYFMGKLFFDGMMADTFRRGLQRLKSLIEAESPR